MLSFVSAMLNQLGCACDRGQEWLLGGGPNKFGVLMEGATVESGERENASASSIFRAVKENCHVSTSVRRGSFSTCDSADIPVTWRRFGFALTFCPRGASGTLPGITYGDGRAHPALSYPAIVRPIWLEARRSLGLRATT